MYKLTEKRKETLRKMSEINRGRVVSEQSRKKMSESKKGKKCYIYGKKQSQESNIKRSIALRGKPKTPEHIEKVALRHRGKPRTQFSKEKHWNWQGGKTPINHLIRNSIEYKLWRKAVFERDNYTCVWCRSNKSGTLNADHIKPFAYYPELRFAIDNGRTLCVECHRKTDSYMKKLPPIQ